MEAPKKQWRSQRWAGSARPNTRISVPKIMKVKFVTKLFKNSQSLKKFLEFLNIS